uniref:Putative plant transposon protein domain-containing protein n=1 Tax=Solanum tuberosum TaxID=4113 RepID=M1D9B6_SOLTU
MDRDFLYGQLYDPSSAPGTMGPRRKNVTKPAPVTASQSEGHGDSEASGSEVQINVSPEDHSPRATRSLGRRAILQDSPPQSEEGGSSSENGENSGCPTDTAAATLMNFAADTETTKRGQKDMASTWGPLNSIIVRGKSIDISEALINRMLYGPEYSAPVSVGLFEGKHHEVTSDATMEDQTSRERVLCWIAKHIAIDGENAGWVTTTPTLITKASLSFPAKHASGGYPVNAGRIIAIEMRDRALNERAALPFPCMIGKLCRGANIPLNSLVDRWGETFRLTQVSKIKDVANHLFGAKSAAIGTLAVIPHVPLEIPQASRDPEQGESSQSSTEAPPPPASASQTSGTFITIPMLFLEKLVADQPQTRTLVDPIVLRMPQMIETKDRFQATGSADTEEFRTQLAEMRTQIANLAEKPAQVPIPVMPESLMQILSQAPSTQTLDDLWGEPPTSKSGKRKHITGELDEETPTNPARKARRQEKRARRAL